MEKTHLNKKIVFLTDELMSVKLMYCSECRIHTKHHRTPSGEWVCWCGNVDDEEETKGESRD